MPIIKEISGISIENKFIVSEIRGIDVDTGNEVLLRANEGLSSVYYLYEPNSRKNLIIMLVQLGENKTPSLFVEDPQSPDNNLLIVMERRLTGGEP